MSAPCVNDFLLARCSICGFRALQLHRGSWGQWIDCVRHVMHFGVFSTEGAFESLSVTEIGLTYNLTWPK